VYSHAVTHDVTTDAISNERSQTPTRLRKTANDVTQGSLHASRLRHTPVIFRELFNDAFLYVTCTASDGRIILERICKEVVMAQSKD
jgi:hypothetical protein